MKTFIILFCLITEFTLAQNEWVKIGEMPRPVYGARAVVIDTAIYIVGGFDDQLPDNSSNKYSDSIRVYYPESGTWGTSVKMVEPRYGLIAANYNDSLIYLGGIATINANSSSIEVWNRNTTPYLYKFNQDFERHYGTGVASGGNLFLFGGNNSLLNFNYLSKINIQSGNTVFNSNFNLTVALTNQASATDNNNIYLFGGIQVSIIGVGTIQTVINSIYKYEISSNTQTLLGTQLNRPLSFCDVVYFGNAQYYIIGGIDESNILSEVEIFDAAKLQITSGPSLNKARKELTAVKYHNSIYVFGGIDDNKQSIKDIEKLDVITGISQQENSIINDYHLYNNYPNPFNPSTIIKYSVPKESFVSLKIYNIIGEEIKTLVNEKKSAGNYAIKFNAYQNGNSLPSGVYFYKLQVADFSQTKKMMLLK